MLGNSAVCVKLDEQFIRASYENRQSFDISFVDAGGDSKSIIETWLKLRGIDAGVYLNWDSYTIQLK